MAIRASWKRIGLHNVGDLIHISHRFLYYIVPNFGSVRGDYVAWVQIDIFFEMINAAEMAGWQFDPIEAEQLGVYSWI